MRKVKAIFIGQLSKSGPTHAKYKKKKKSKRRSIKLQMAGLYKGWFFFWKRIVVVLF